MVAVLLVAIRGRGWGAKHKWGAGEWDGSPHRHVTQSTGANRKPKIVCNPFQNCERSPVQIATQRKNAILAAKTYLQSSETVRP